MKSQKRVYPSSVKVYFPKPEDEDLFQAMSAIADRSRLSLSFLALILIERGLPGVEESLNVLRGKRANRKSKSK